MTYRVESYDAFDAPAERRHLKHGEFEHGAEALATAQRVIDKDLLRAIAAGKSAAEALDQWRHFGEVPMIFGDPPVAFDPFDYAERRAVEIERAERRRMMDEFDKLIETSFLPSLNRAARESANTPPPSGTIKDDAEPDDKKG